MVHVYIDLCMYWYMYLHSYNLHNTNYELCIWHYCVPRDVDVMQAMQEQTYLFQPDEFLRYTNNEKHESQCLMESAVRKITLNQKHACMHYCW